MPEIVQEVDTRTRRKQQEIDKPLTDTLNRVDVGRAFELRMKGMQYEEIANMMGVSKQAVHQRLKQFAKVLENPESLDTYDRNVDKILSAAQIELLSRALDSDKLEKSSTFQLIGSYGLLFDKQRLVRGLSTANVQYGEMTQTEREIEDQVRMLEAKLIGTQYVVPDPTHNVDKSVSD